MFDFTEQIHLTVAQVVSQQPKVEERNLQCTLLRSFFSMSFNAVINCRSRMELCNKRIHEFISCDLKKYIS